ncbi:MAG: UPF0280 family protein [Methanomicrobiales archaeon]|nr:UPF0280 family protein [Methanomicrobiales archaeon]
MTLRGGGDPFLRRHFEFRETIATILAKDHHALDAAESGMITARQEVEACIAADPYFRTTFEPYHVSFQGTTVGRMVQASEAAGVGPMAAVAGAIAWAGIDAMAAAGAECGVVDNGGDIALFGDGEVTIGLYAGESPLSDRFAFLVSPGREVLGVCTSSATVGPSISFGVADAVTVFARDVALADAFATSICNSIRPGDSSVLDRLRGSGISGVTAVMGDEILTWGDVPRLVPARGSRERITAGFALPPGT